MKELHGLSGFGLPHSLSDDMLKQTRLANIRTRAGKMAYLLSLGKKAKKPQIKEGVYEARGALKWIEEILKDGEEK